MHQKQLKQYESTLFVQKKQSFAKKRDIAHYETMPQKIYMLLG